MRGRAPASVAALASLILCATPVFALTAGRVSANFAIGRLPGGVPMPAPLIAPALGGGFAMPVLALAAPSIAPVPVARPALASAQALTAAIAAAEGGRDAAPALSAAFDGPKAASSDDGVFAEAPAARTPESFALRAERLFTAGRLPPGRRAAVAWHDGARPEGAAPTDEEMFERMARSPLTNPERERVVVELFKLAGAKESDIVFQDVGRGRRNIMVVKKGRTDRVIVVGAHHDKVNVGAGTIDNWTGATLVPNLYQAMNGVETDATIVFIAFAREEEGLIGSREYVRSLTEERRAKVDAMINLDSLAVNGTFSWKNNSTRALLDRLASVSRESGHALKEDNLSGGDSDSSSFRDADISAATVYGASQDVISDIIHSERDTMAAFSLPHYKNAYLLTLAALKSLDRTPLGPVGRGNI